MASLRKPYFWLRKRLSPPREHLETILKQSWRPRKLPECSISCRGPSRIGT